MIPKPPKQIKISADVRMKRLIRWKELFEAISPEIRVFVRDHKIKYDNNFNNECERILEGCGHRYFLGINSSDFEIAVDLPEGYLMGYSNNHMFSDKDIDNDTRLMIEHEMEDVAYDPETRPWKDCYKETCAQY